MIRLLSFIILLCASAASLAGPDGATLFAQNCAACHGDKGTGGIGVPLALPSFQASISDDYVRKTIRMGRPGRIMPAFQKLSDAEVDAVVGYVRSWNKAAALQFDPTPIKGDAARGKQLYSQHCAACHGANGEGGKGTGVTFSRPRELPIMPPALHNPGFLAAASDSMIKHTLLHGREGTPMVAAASKGLTERDVNDLVSHIRQFEHEPLPASATLLESESATLSLDSPYDLATTIENLKRAVESNNFVFIREQKLQAGLVAEGQENPRQHIIYFCNFGFLNQALAQDPRVGLFLPCRITVVEDKGKVRLLAVNPKRLSKIFNDANLNQLCEQMTQQYRTIMEEATL